MAWTCTWRPPRSRAVDTVKCEYLRWHACLCGCATSVGTLRKMAVEVQRVARGRRRSPLATICGCRRSRWGRRHGDAGVPAEAGYGKREDKYSKVDANLLATRHEQLSPSIPAGSIVVRKLPGTCRTLLQEPRFGPISTCVWANLTPTRANVAH